MENKDHAIGFVGLGKLGLPVALGMANKGHRVVGYDVMPTYLNVQRSKVFKEVEEGIEGLLDHDGLKVVGDLREVVSQCSMIFLAVQTPHDPAYEGATRVPSSVANFNYTFLKSAIDNVVGLCEEMKLDRILVIISTVLPGTMSQLIPSHAKHVRFCYNPYFIAMGTVLHDFYHPEFILLGANDQWAADQVQAFYKTITDSRVFRTTIENAELIKVSYNTMISMKLAFVNQLMEICDHTPNTNVDDVTDALKLATKRLVSPAYMTAGMGDGGGCHPRDNIAMSWLARELNLKTDFCAFIMKAREMQTEYLADVACNYAKETSLPIIVLGKAFKPNTRLTTGSPSVLLYNIIKERTENVEIVDDMPPSAPIAVYVIGTRHDRFQEIRFPKGSVIVDPNRYISPQEGCLLHSVGKPSSFSSS